MATKWIGTIACRWCGKRCRVGIEKDGRGNTYRLICSTCGLMGQTAFHYPAGEDLARELAS